MRALLPLAVLAVAYAGIILRLQPATLTGDEPGYLFFATNLVHGFYSPSDTIRLWWGPGYPLLLAPFVAVHSPLIVPRLLNAAMMLAAVVLTYKTARLYLPARVAFLLGAYMAVYVPALAELPYLLVEPLALMLACLWMYLFCAAHAGRATSRRRGALLAGSAVALAYLALAKIFFGWVIVASLAVSLIAVVFRRSAMARWQTLTFAGALVLCVPYLVYTYSLTHHLFYWGSSGGLSLYWMSSPYPGELGDWFELEAMRDRPELAPNHAQFFTQIKDLDEVQQNDALEAAAITNIVHHPVKYVANWINNIGRLLINYPYSFTPFKPQSVLIGLANAPVVILSLYALVLLVQGKARLAPGLVGVATVAALAFLGTSLLSAYLRQFVLLVPWLGVFGAATVWPVLGKGERKLRA